MKRSAAAVLAAASGAYAQSFRTSIYVECTATAPRSGTATNGASGTFTPTNGTGGTFTPTNSAGGTFTQTNTMTSTYCDLCEHMSSTMISGQPVHVTAWETVYTNVCSTGLTPATFTITESCTGETPTFTGPGNTGYVPPGFTTSVVACDVCEHPTTGMYYRQ